MMMAGLARVMVLSVVPQLMLTAVMMSTSMMSDRSVTSSSARIMPKNIAKGIGIRRPLVALRRRGICVFDSMMMSQENLQAVAHPALGADGVGCAFRVSSGNSEGEGSGLFTVVNKM